MAGLPESEVRRIAAQIAENTTPGFDGIATGTNTTATMTVGTGASVTTSGSGTVNANQFKGNATVALADGGTAAALTAAAGGLVYSGASALAVQAAGTSGYFARSGGTGAPTWFDLLGTANTWTANQTISNTAPALILTDTTASAKSLTIAVDANVANVRESAGASGSLLALDLANNRVGIGTASPSTKLNLFTTMIPTIRVDAGDTVQTLNYTGAISAVAQNGYGSALSAQAAGALAWGGIFQNTGGSAPLVNLAGGTSNPYAALFQNGNVGIGTTSPSYQLQLSTDSAAKPSTNTWTVASDRRLKTNIRPYTEGLAFLAQLHPVRFVYTGVGGMPVDEESIGFVAQDVQAVAPQMVSATKGKLTPRPESDGVDAHGKPTYKTIPKEIVDATPETDILAVNVNEMQYAMLNALMELDRRLTTVERRP